MTGAAPQFTKSKYFVAKPKWHMKLGASEEDKRALESYMNPDYDVIIDHPEMENPYYTWSGKVIDKG